MKKKILCIISSMNVGGAETFLMKVYRSIDITKYQMDFCVSERENFYENEINSLGGNIYYNPPKSKNFFKSFIGIIRLVKKNKYESVLRINEHSLATIDLIAAKIGGAEKLIMRSSNASSSNKMQIILHKIFKFLPKTIPDLMLAPSYKAAEYTFGKKKIKNNGVVILKNGLDLDEFKYSENNREYYRNKFDINDKFVVGHVGRFNLQKNHVFLLQTFNKFQEKHDNSVLLMVGNGPLIDEVKNEAMRLGILEKCIFAGSRNDVCKIYSAMDAFLFPSLYEGMPNVVIEAQASGLPCIISDTITKEVNITNLIKFISLDNSYSDWADNILFKSDLNRYDSYKTMQDHGYDIKTVSDKFVNLIFCDDHYK